MPKPSGKAHNKALGEMVRKLRKSRDMTLQQLAAELDISHQQLQKYETGANQVSVPRMQQLVRILKPPKFYFAAFYEPAEDSKKAKAGFADEGAAYIHDGARSLEAEDLQRSFAKLKDPEHRKTVLSLVKNLAGAERKGKS